VANRLPIFNNYTLIYAKQNKDSNLLYRKCIHGEQKNFHIKTFFNGKSEVLTPEILFQFLR